MEFSSPIFILVSIIPSVNINELTGLRAAVVKVNVELILRDVLLAEKKFLEKGLAEDFAQLENGKN
ncbi:hypothetical protein [Flavobacterium tructae]|uniref:Uncharacterized protein n=1 Tax=Flavobacterium tructae TaxID=1114873 RepID=A0A1S1J2F7_9FLAO|nr:hypothetical protein [Flavobacterium tructae]OHT43950.1 hypothetical protein BHE19_16575 [Flavobacterium tructae]OXB21535.1 hypothetical protein B0A71_03245 [Flavobacterium tructae]